MTQESNASAIMYEEPTAANEPDTDIEQEQQLEKARAAERVPVPEEGAVPDWVQVPEGFRFPRGMPLVFMRLRCKYTPSMGQDRQLICWPINIADQKLALGRSQGDNARAVDEMTKQMVRVVDGMRVDWSGAPGPANIDQWWDMIGAPNRNLLNRVFTQLHIPSPEQVSDFFESCIAVRMGS